MEIVVAFSRNFGENFEVLQRNMDKLSKNFENTWEKFPECNFEETSTNF